MKYSAQILESEAKYYSKILSKLRGKEILLVIPRLEKKSFFSLAPFSMAAHNLGRDLRVFLPNGNSRGVEVLEDVWACFKDMKQGVKNPATKAMREYIRLVSKKIPDFEGIFKEPAIKVYATKEGFKINDEIYDYKTRWFVPYKAKLLKETCAIVWKKVFAIKPNEIVSCGLDLVPDKSMLELPLEDYLDNFAISYAMAETCPGKPFLGASTSRESQLARALNVSELFTTLTGCELEKDINEPIFRAFRSLSKLLGISRLRLSDAIFGISGKGYYGKHVFGERIGYPTKNRKSRWQTPTQMGLKLAYYPQTKDEERLPLTRIGFTSTLPIDVFIQTCHINWDTMRKRNLKLQAFISKADIIDVEGEKVKGGQTKFRVYMKKPDGTRRHALISDGDAVFKVDPDHFKSTGIKAGTMANIPAGEVFMTPEKLKGTFIGDVVISLDQSYMLDGKNPLVIEANGNYKIKSGPKKIVDKFNEKKRESWKIILEEEKHKSVPKKLTQLKKKNFNGIGEFAINTNPKAKLCNYLIVNEKIANMIHIALGSGFEPDRATTYHTDIVIDAPRQKMDITATINGKKVKVMHKGKLCV